MAATQRAAFSLIYSRTAVHRLLLSQAVRSRLPHNSRNHLIAQRHLSKRHLQRDCQKPSSPSSIPSASEIARALRSMNEPYALANWSRCEAASGVHSASCVSTSSRESCPLPARPSNRVRYSSTRPVTFSGYSSLHLHYFLLVLKDIPAMPFQMGGRRQKSSRAYNRRPVILADHLKYLLVLGLPQTCRNNHIQLVTDRNQAPIEKPVKRGAQAKSIARVRSVLFGHTPRDNVACDKALRDS